MIGLSWLSVIEVPFWYIIYSCQLDMFSYDLCQDWWLVTLPRVINRIIMDYQWFVYHTHILSIYRIMIIFVASRSFKWDSKGLKLLIWSWWFNEIRKIHQHDDYNRIQWTQSRIETWHDSFKNHKMIWDVSNKPQKEGWLIHGATSSTVIWNTSICDLTMKSQSNTPEVLGQLWRQGQGPRILGDVSIIDIGWYRDSCQLPVFFS